ncbi:MAG TPA: hypothetical protein ENI90_07885, partial [Methylothermaceae bacterium]|nr:hypothetical protein [Methylothermaceae bacterium]
MAVQFPTIHANLVALDPPVMVDVIPRQRLFAQLDQGRRRPCVWVTASAGYGKTSLLASYVADREIPCLWYPLKRADADPMHFFRRLAAAIAMRYPALALPEISVINMNDPESFGEVFFAPLTKTRLTIVLDDYHHLMVDSAVHPMLIPGLETLGAGRWLVASRTPPPESLMRLVANDAIECLATDDLKFTREETTALLSTRHLGDDPQQLQTLSEGWAAGLVLLIKHRQMGLPTSTSEGLVFGYFMHEIVSQIDAEPRRFLMICALIADITPAMAEALTGYADSDQRLESAARSYAFVTRSREDPPVYRFHALFRQVLLEMGRNEWGTRAWAGLQQQAYRCLVETRRLDEAVEVLVELEDWEELIRLIGGQAEALLFQGEVHTLKSWIQRVPADIAKTVTWLGFWGALCDLPFSPAETRRRLEQVLERFKGANDPAGIYLTWSFIVESVWFEMDDCQPLRHWSRVLEQLQKEHPVPDALPIRARVLYARFIIASLLMTEKEDILEEQMMGLLESDLPSEQKVAYASMMMFRAYGRRGGGDRCRNIRASVNGILAAEKISPMSRFGWYFNSSLYDYAFGELPDSLATSLVEARNVAERHGFKTWLLNVQLNLCEALCMQGEGREAERVLNTLSPYISKAGRYHSGYHLFLMAWCRLLDGQLDVAMDRAGQILALSPETRTTVPSLNAIVWLAVAQIALARGERGKALVSLAHSRRISRETGHQHLESSAQLLLAAYAFATQRPQRGLRILRRVLAIAREEGYRHFTLQIPGTLAHLCAVALNADIEADYAKTLIRANRLTAPRGIVCDAWPWPVRIRALGPLRIEVHGEPLVFQGRTHVKPLAMLKVLIVEEFQPVSADHVAEILWPEADGEQCKANTKTTLQRLRKLIGQEAVVLKDGCLSLNPALCWLDSVAFKRQLGTAGTDAISIDDLEDHLH